MKPENYGKFTFVSINTVWAEGEERFLCVSVVSHNGRGAQWRPLSPWPSAGKVCRPLA